MSREDNTRTYNREESVVFLRTKEVFGGLSNMAAGFSLKVNGASIRTAEALYQACRFPRYAMVQQEIIDQASPISAKMKARRQQTRWMIRNDWMNVRLKVMRWVLRVKLAQNFVDLGSLLESTGNKPIVEESSKGDDYWGTIAQKDNENILVGVNALGRLLMELRDEYREKGSKMKAVEPPNIPDFLFMGKPIGRIQ